jgi:hypothetical protein
VSKELHNTLKQIWDTFEQRIELTETSKMIYTLQKAVQKLATKIETNTKEQNTQELGSGRYSYTAVARRGIPVHTEQSCTEQSHIEPEKAVSVWHKHKLIVTQGTETTVQMQQTGQEIVKQLNKAGMSGQIVTARHLSSDDIVFTTDKETTCTKWTADQKWVSVFGEGTQVKRQEFVVIVYRIKVKQVQNPVRAIKDIYQQNPKLQGLVEILQMAWSKKLICTG